MRSELYLSLTSYSYGVSQYSLIDVSRQPPLRIFLVRWPLICPSVSVVGILINCFVRASVLLELDSFARLISCALWTNDYSRYVFRTIRGRPVAF